MASGGMPMAGKPVVGRLSSHGSPTLMSMHETPPMRTHFRPLLWFLLLWASVVVQPAAAQNIWITPGAGSYTTAANWSAGTVPDGTEAIIGGTDPISFALVSGTATLSSVAPTLTALTLGSTAGTTGGLNINSGGQLAASLDIFGLGGAASIGQNGTGLLSVAPGGRLDAITLTSAGGGGSSIALGGTAAGTATVNITDTGATGGAVTLGRILRVIGPNVNFSSSGPAAGITFQGTSTFIPEITAATHSALKTTGTATLGGTFQIDFNGVTPAGGNAWNLIDAATINGSFASIVPDPNVSVAGPGQELGFRIVNGGVNGRLAQLFVEQLPILVINRNTGAATITNPGASGIELDGYSVHSPLGGVMKPGWRSLEKFPAVAGSGWEEANTAAPSRVSEVRSGAASTLAAGGSWTIGNIYQRPVSTAIGQDVEDLTFDYTQPDDTTRNRPAVFVGTTGLNNLILFVETNGTVRMRNPSPHTVEFDAYTITSSAGSLQGDAQWTSLEETIGGTWEEGNLLPPNRVSEVKRSGSQTFAMNDGTTFNLGQLFNPAGAKDLVFEYLLNGEDISRTGQVVYGVPGDYNSNGVVDAGDYTVWRNNRGLSVNMPNDTSPGVVNIADFNLWKANYGQYSIIAGSGAGSGQLSLGSEVPEPAGWLLASIGGVLAAVRRRVRFGRHEF